jgi:hypothetical protein
MIAKKCVLAFATVVLMWPVLAAAEEGRPATAADLSGKSICWDGGRLVTTYYADGRELNNHGKHSVWSVPEPGLGSVLNRDSRLARVVIQGLRLGGDLDSEATFLVERRGVEAG